MDAKCGLHDDLAEVWRREYGFCVFELVGGEADYCHRRKCKHFGIVDKLTVFLILFKKKFFLVLTLFFSINAFVTFFAII